MKKRTSTYKTTFAALGIFMLVVLLGGALSAATNQEAKPGKSISNAARADIVTVDRLDAGFDKREKPQVTFLHDQHITALGEKGKDCSTCHGVTDRGYYDFVYKDSKGKTGSERKDFFHNACVSCHQERSAAGASTGPQNVSECSSCHMEKRPYATTLKQVRMPLALHAVHSDAKVIAPKKGEKDNCSVCHHSVVPDELSAPGAPKDLVLVRGEEQACFTCHFAVETKGVHRLDSVSHQACLSCHAKLALENKESGPTNCSTCHAVPLSLERKYADGPRLERGQPALTFIMPKPLAGEQLPSMVMSPAVFNHTTHELKADQCSTCHHKRIESCGNCHTISGNERAKNISAYQANHTQGNMSVSKLVKYGDKPIWGPGETCTGCHQQTARANAQCAGCHANPSLKVSTDSCNVCHIPMGGNAGKLEAAKAIAALSDAGKAQMAQQAVSLREIAQVKVNLDDIPEFVSIGVMAKEYEPVKLEHRKIVKALLEPARADKLATAFHMGDLRACAGCHHNSPASLNPPACASCHPRDAINGKVEVIPLKAAYHQQCMSCHNAMNLAAPKDTDCKSCHLPKNK